MKKKKGFTLIELLAVIVILAIIALIAVPVIMNILDKANKSALKDTAYGVISAGELYFAGQQLELNGMSGEKTFTFPTTEIEVKGNVPEGTVLKVREDGKIALTMTNGRYCITKKYEDNNITVSEDLTACGVSGGENGTGGTDDDSNPSGINYTALAEVAVADLGLEIPSCVTSGTCEAGTPIAIQVNDTETYKFRVLNDDGDTVNLIMEGDVGTAVPWNDLECDLVGGEDYSGDGVITPDEADGRDCTAAINQGPLKPLETLKTQTSDWTNLTEYSYELDYQTGTYSDEFVQNVRARLPQFSDTTTDEIGCKIDNGNSCAPWLEEGGTEFWLTDVVEGKVWIQTYSIVAADISSGLDRNYSVRPVITLSK